MFLASPILTTLAGVLGLVLVDWLLGVAVAIKDGNFAFSALPRQLESEVAPYVGGVSLIGVLQALASGGSLSTTATALGATFAAAAGAYSVRLALDVKDKLLALAGSGSSVTVGTPPPVTAAVPPTPPAARV